MPNVRLHGALIRPTSSEPRQVCLFLHGILGTGSNLRGLAQAYVQAVPQSAALLVDLRLHGRSHGFSPPHDVVSCARDLLALEPTLAWPVTGVIGHSFGGKVALAYHRERPELSRLGLLDSAPGARPDRAGSEQTSAVLETLERVPKSYRKRDEFIELVRREGHSRAIAEWLAMNLQRTPDGFALALDLAGIGALLESYFSLDLWPVLEGSSARIDLVIGGRSQVWDESDRARIARLAAQKPERVRVHVLAQAGHWLHVDDPQGVRQVLFADASPETDTP